MDTRQTWRTLLGGAIAIALAFVTRALFTAVITGAERAVMARRFADIDIPVPAMIGTYILNTYQTGCALFGRAITIAFAFVTRTLLATVTAGAWHAVVTRRFANVDIGFPSVVCADVVDTGQTGRTLFGRAVTIAFAFVARTFLRAIGAISWLMCAVRTCVGRVTGVADSVFVFI